MAERRKREPRKSLRVLTYNVKMLPGLTGGGDTDLQRATRIVEAILSVQPAYDVVCLQEVFDEDTRVVFDQGLKTKFPHRVIKCHDGDIFHEDSGLFFASRHPIKMDGKAWGYEEFEEKGPATTADYWADKGIFGARLDVSRIVPGLSLCVFQTHMQSDHHAGEFAEVRRQQMHQIRRFVTKALRRVNHAPNTVALFMGDCNVIAETVAHDALLPTPEYQQMLSLLGSVRDLFRLQNPADPGFTWDAEKNKKMIPASDGDRLRLDYVLAYENIPPFGPHTAEIRLCPFKVRQAQVQTFGKDARSHLSDHFAVDVTIEPEPHGQPSVA
jgi:endonuclease/exonuclease/phosphatase family metal-dependent hydrolase